MRAMAGRLPRCCPAAAAPGPPSRASPDRRSCAAPPSPQYHTHPSLPRRAAPLRAVLPLRHGRGGVTRRARVHADLGEWVATLARFQRAGMLLLASPEAFEACQQELVNTQPQGPLQDQLRAEFGRLLEGVRPNLEDFNKVVFCVNLRRFASNNANLFKTA